MRDFKIASPLFCFKLCYLILKSNKKCFCKGRALSNVFWIYQNKIVISRRIEFSTSETIKQFINWSENSDKKQEQYLVGGGIIQAIHYHQYICDFFPIEEANFSFPSFVVVVFLIYSLTRFPYCSFLMLLWYISNFNFPSFFVISRFLMY